MRFWITALIIILTSVVNAQEVRLTGRVMDMKQRPLKDVSIRINKDYRRTTKTNENGFYSVVANANDSLTLEYRYSHEGKSLNELQTIYVTSSDTIIPTILFVLDVQVVNQVNVHQDILKPTEIPELKIKDWQLIPSLNGVEQVLKYTTAASSNNELTSNYNVRGGSYDENLVYVNGFQIFRPFLTRSGQQEGMSFINSAFVNSLQFSGGGFDARYGDKMSSVLDVNYRDPDTLGASVMASMLGVEAHIEQILGKRKYFSYMLGARYRSNGYFLNSLPAKGAYNPVFYDVQLLTNQVLNENWVWSTIAYYSSNNYRFIPQTQETDFGTANEAYSFRIYYDGQEQTQFNSLMGGTKFAYQNERKGLDLNFYASVYNSDEKEYFDVQGQYFINQLETDPSKEEFGDSIAVLGIGTFLNHARNRLRATIYSTYHDGAYHYKGKIVKEDTSVYRRSDILWGYNLRYEDFVDRLSEWKLIDSAGYSIPQANDGTIKLFETIKGDLNLQSFRAVSYGQLNTHWSLTKKNYIVSKTKTYKKNGQKITETYTDTLSGATAKWVTQIGSRFGYTSANNEFFATPRVSVTYMPRAYMVRDSSIVKRYMAFRFSTGLYYQPPIYREFRTFEGDLRLGVLAQKSYHAILGYDMYFDMWGREQPFKFTAEGFFKYIWDLNPFEVENVRTRYFANNDAVAYAYGLDLNMHGEFVPGIESFFKVGLLSTKEDLANDSYTEYYNAAGEKIIFGFSEDQTVVDSATFYPGYIPRPTDQWINVGALVQDQMPNIPAWSVQMGLNYGSPLPYGPPDASRYKDTLRMKSYFRVDIGTSYDFLYNKDKKSTFWSKNFSDAILSFEVFNLLGINNVLSKQWIQDVNGTYYSVPNYLTSRRFNLKLILRL